MATPAQITANRLNSLQSTGPRTQEGRAASSANAFKHGFTSRKIVPAARQQEFDLLAGAYRDEYQPATVEQHRLLDIMIFAAWNLIRYHEIWDQLWETLMRNEGGEPKSMTQAFLDDCTGPKVIDKLHRYTRDLERSYDRARRDLLALRHAAPAPAPARAPQARPSAPALPPSSPIPEIGFVSSSDFFVPPPPPRTAKVTAPGYEHLHIRL